MNTTGSGSSTGGLFSIPNTPNLSMRSAGSGRHHHHHNHHHHNNNNNNHDSDKGLLQLTNNNENLDKINMKLNQSILEKNLSSKLHHHLKDQELNHLSGVHSPKLDHHRSNIRLDATPPESPNLSSQQYWKCRLTNLKNNFLGSPRFHRKKMPGK